MNNRHDPSDSYLIEQYKSGNKAVLPILVKRWHKQFCEKAYWVTKNRDEAKDIAQESWLTIIANFHKLKNPDRFYSWASRIVYTKAIDSAKAKGKRSNIMKSYTSLNMMSEEALNPNEPLKKHLLTTIQKLSKEKQDVLRLFYMEEYSIYEISRFLNVPVGTVKSRLFKSREKLKSILKNIKYEK